MVDFIGDIHGYCDKLEALLKKLGYKKLNGVYTHSESKAVFLGDYIDRGPQIRETLNIIRSMVEDNRAIALMGNHEYNAICFNYQSKEKGYLRKHSIKNIIQHSKTIEQFYNRQDEYDSYIEWFKTLPLYYETDDFRAVHACWDDKNIECLKKYLVDQKLNDTLIDKANEKGTELNESIEETLKGKEIKLPHEVYFYDKENIKRGEVRIRWWEEPTSQTYRSISLEPSKTLPNENIDTKVLKSTDYYRADEKNIFFGHYWLRGKPSLFKKNICCLDYSVARGGKLMAYRYSGEKILDNKKFVYK